MEDPRNPDWPTHNSRRMEDLPDDVIFISDDSRENTPMPKRDATPFFPEHSPPLDMASATREEVFNFAHARFEAAINYLSERGESIAEVRSDIVDAVIAGFVSRSRA
jgi:hypothetical protein